MLCEHTTITAWEIRITTVDYNPKTKRMVLIDYFTKIAEQEDCEDYHWTCNGGLVSDDLGYELDEAFDDEAFDNLTMQ